MLKYLIHIKSYEIIFNAQAINSNCIFFESSNASFADDLKTRYNSQKYCFKLFDDMIDWKASKQKTVTINLTEAKLLAIFMTANIKMWWNRFLEIIVFQTSFTYIKCDNRQTIRVFTTSETFFNIKLRHVDIHRHWLRQKIQNETVNIKWILNINILADELIKILLLQRHKKFVKLIDFEDVLTACIIKKDENEKIKKKAKDAEEAA